MGYPERKQLFVAVEELRKRPLICYVTSSRRFAHGEMASDVIPELAKQLNLIQKDTKAIDLLIVSDGGDPTVSWRFISMMRERFEEIGALLPFAAYSAATLLALGANEILMHPYSNLGPVDPQLQYIRREGQQEEPINFGSEDLRHFFDYIRKDIGISDQEQLQQSLDLICKDVGAIPIGVAKRSSYLAVSMGEKLLRLHMQDENKTRAIAEALNTSFYHHGYPLGRKEAKSIGLPVVDPEPELEKLMWDIWQNFEEDMVCNVPFNPIEVVFNDDELSQLLSPVPQLQMPSNLPPQLVQQVFQQIVQNITITSIKPVEYALFRAALESTRCRSEYWTFGKINAVRKPDMSIAISVLPLKQSWKFICE